MRGRLRRALVLVLLLGVVESVGDEAAAHKEAMDCAGADSMKYAAAMAALYAELPNRPVGSRDWHRVHQYWYRNWRCHREAIGDLIVRLFALGWDANASLFSGIASDPAYLRALEVSLLRTTHESELQATLNNLSRKCSSTHRTYCGILAAAARKRLSQLPAAP
jgi:hypothetical protein